MHSIFHYSGYYGQDHFDISYWGVLVRRVFRCGKERTGERQGNWRSAIAGVCNYTNVAKAVGGDHAQSPGKLCRGTRPPRHMHSTLWLESLGHPLKTASKTDKRGASALSPPYFLSLLCYQPLPQPGTASCLLKKKLSKCSSQSRRFQGKNKKEPRNKHCCVCQPPRVFCGRDSVHWYR